ncbi:hypothetical protein CDD80_1174 [Ophiocordyceps camponoti-rufipedis]|uniref:Uncharacterized protein n=1 Tax=Ophiocordyceps camponoti-rufipedis TaxID=2004952 RepID=A0A2C5ZAD6_9HYPO|nr:hypothetical protein CDD80_1174 [Ophiocordyceps camponoti-rufipedis]
MSPQEERWKLPQTAFYIINRPRKRRLPAPPPMAARERGQRPVGLPAQSIRERNREGLGAVGTSREKTDYLSGG